METLEMAHTWVREAKEEGATHVISVCDTFSNEDYPVQVFPGEDLEEKKKHYDNVDMQKINHVLDVKEDDLNN